MQPCLARACFPSNLVATRWSPPRRNQGLKCVCQLLQQTEQSPSNPHVPRQTHTPTPPDYENLTSHFRLERVPGPGSPLLCRMCPKFIASHRSLKWFFAQGPGVKYSIYLAGAGKLDPLSLSILVLPPPCPKRSHHPFQPVLVYLGLSLSLNQEKIPRPQKEPSPHFP